MSGPPCKCKNGSNWKIYDLTEIKWSEKRVDSDS